MSTGLVVARDSNPNIPRSRSSSIITGPATPESQSSDSPSSSDPDIYLGYSNPPANKSLFAMEVDTAPNSHLMDMETDMSFDTDFEVSQAHGVQSLTAFSANLDDIVLNGLSNLNANTKTDMLSLEEIIQDGAFEPSSPVGPPFQSYPLRSLALHDLFIPPPSPLVRHANSSPQLEPVCIDPSSTQHIQSPTHLPAISQVSSAVTSPSSFKPELPGVLLLSPGSQTAGDMSTPLRSEAPSSHSLLPYDPRPPVSVSNEVVRPPKEECVDLPIFFPSIPADGTKSRVETQIKLTFELGYPISLSAPRYLRKQGPAVLSASQVASPSTSSSNSPSTSPSLSKPEFLGQDESSSQLLTHDRVGTYQFIRLPQGTATKRKPTSTKISGRSSGVKAEETLEMTAEVVCCSPPHAVVQSCSSCQSREAKRTARKLAARVRPSRPKTNAKKSGKKGKEQGLDGAEHADTEEDEEDEPNADASIIQFNCAEIVDFSGGSIVLPMRITCYCRHHKEKIGFNIVFTIRDCLGRIVGRGTTPPILITDDHKSNNAMSKLPPMHPLRQALNPPTSLLPSLMTPENSEDIKLTSPQPDQDLGRTLVKRRDTDSVAKKRRPKPYDGRPTSRITSVRPGIEGRQGLVLALHPAHATSQASTTHENGPSHPSSRATSASPDAESSTSPVLRARSLSPPVLSENSLPSSPPSVSGIFAGQVDVTSAFELGARLPPQASPSSLASLLPTAPSSPSLHSSVSSKLGGQALQSSLQSLSELQALSSQQQTFLDTTSFPLYSPLPLTLVPKVHRLIPSSGPTTGGIEITVLGSNFHVSMPLECVFGGAVASSTHRWSDNTLVCVLPPRAAPGLVGVGLRGIKDDAPEDGGACLFNYVDESDRQLMELALQVVGLKMTGKIEEARNVAMRIVGNTPTPTTPNGDVAQLNSLTSAQFAHHSFLPSLGGMDLETLVIKLLTLLDVPRDDATTSLVSTVIGHQNATGQTLLHLAVMLALPALVSCLAQRSIDLDVCNTNGLTALHFAAMTGWKEGAEILLAAGADASVVDRTGFTAADRARFARSQELEKILLNAVEHERISECGSGEEGDDEAWHNGEDVSDDGASDVNPLSSWQAAAPPQYTVRSRRASRSLTHSSSDELSEPEERQLKKPSAPAEIAAQEVSPRVLTDEKHPIDEKQTASFVGRLQRNLPQGILQNVQIPGLAQLQMPGFPHLQLPDKLAGPWGALPQIPVFPVFVPMPNLPNLPHLPHWPTFPWMDGEKKESDPGGEHEEKHQQQPTFATLWTACDNIANNAWRAQWEKWTAHVTALQNADTRSTEEPPKYTPRESSQPLDDTKTIPTDTAKGDVGSPSSGNAVTGETIVASTSRLPATKATRRMGYNSVKIPDTEVDSYHYQPKKKVNHKKKDHMLVLFWIPILFIGIAYALYTTVPVALAGMTRATKRFIPQLPQRDDIPV